MSQTLTLEGILYGCPNHLKWFLSMQNSSNFTLSSSRVTEVLISAGGSLVRLLIFAISFFRLLLKAHDHRWVLEHALTWKWTALPVILALFLVQHPHHPVPNHHCNEIWIINPNNSEEVACHILFYFLFFKKVVVKNNKRNLKLSNKLLNKNLYMTSWNFFLL